MNKHLFFLGFLFTGFSVEYYIHNSSLNKKQINEYSTTEKTEKKNVIDSLIKKENELMIENLKYSFLLNNSNSVNKKYVHLSNSYNKLYKDVFQIKDVKYKTIENYDFNKLSDFFLNIHIFVN